MGCTSSPNWSKMQKIQEEWSAGIAETPVHNDMTYISLDDHIRTLGLTTWAINWLEAAGIKTVGALIGKSDAELLEIRNFGKKNLDSVKAAISAVEKGEGGRCFSPYAAEQYKRLRDRAMTRTSSPQSPIFTAEDGKAYYDIPIAALGFSTRAYNALARYQMFYASKLIGLTEAACLNMDGIGSVTAREIMDCVNTLSFEPAPMSPVKVIRKAHVSLAREFKSSRIANIDFILSLIEKIDPSARYSNEKLLLLLMDEPTLRDAVEHRMYHVIEQSRYGAPLSHIIKKTPILNQCIPKTRELLKSMQERNRIVRIVTGGYIPRYMTLKEYIRSIEDIKAKDLLTSRIHGERYRVMAARYGITKTRAGQIVRKYFLEDPRKPFLREDLYAPIFQKYMFSKEAFMEIFDEPEETFHYLTVVCCKARYYPQPQQVLDFEEDEMIPEIFRKRARAYLAKNTRQKEAIIDNE